MASAKTNATELAFAFGVAGISPVRMSLHGAASYVNGVTSTSLADVQSALVASSSEPALLFRLGQTLVKVCPHLFPSGARISWLGPYRMPRGVSLPMDVQVGQTLVSVKANSHVVYNRSPQNLFVQLPSAKLPLSRSSDWFLLQAPAEYDAAYRAAIIGLPTHLTSGTSFRNRATKSNKKSLQAHLKSMTTVQPAAYAAFEAAELAMAHAVARSSAVLWNQALSALRPAQRSSVFDEIARTFLRLDAVEYVLAGLDNSRAFAVLMPGLPSWKKQCQIKSATATPSLHKGQSEVHFEVTVVPATGPKAPVSLPFRAEIRWSHGKFCGNPEAKLYREFDWWSVPGVTRLI